MDKQVLIILNEYLTKRNLVDFENETNAVIDRQRGKIFTFEDHLRGLIYSLLTNQRKWADVVPKLPQIDKLFFYYNADKILENDGSYFEDGIRKLKCGNISIKKQMEGLHYNISILKKIEKQYGSLDAYVTSKAPEDIVRELSSSSTYKIKGLGNALAWEYLRNVGIDGAKPDTHLKRFMGSERMGVSRHPDASENEVLREVERLSKETGYSKFQIDYIIWCYCADGFGEICTINPKCSKCVVKNYCNMGTPQNLNINYPIKTVSSNLTETVYFSIDAFYRFTTFQLIATKGTLSLRNNTLAYESPKGNLSFDMRSICRITAHENYNYAGATFGRSQPNCIRIDYQDTPHSKIRKYYIAVKNAKQVANYLSSWL